MSTNGIPTLRSLPIRLRRRRLWRRWDESIIKCGSYTGNGSSSGPTLDSGFEPHGFNVKVNSIRELVYIRQYARNSYQEFRKTSTNGYTQIQQQYNEGAIVLTATGFN